MHRCWRSFFTGVFGHYVPGVDTKIICTLKISADTIFYPETQYTDREKERLIHMIYMCDEREIKIAAATVKALLDAR